MQAASFKIDPTYTVHNFQHNSSDMAEEDSMLQITAVMFNVLVTIGQAVPLSDLIIAHDSFAETVENIHAVSVLVAEDKIRLFHTDDCGLMVERVTAESKGLPAEQQRSSFIMGFDYMNWEDCKVIVPRDQALMPSRHQQHME